MSDVATPEAVREQIAGLAAPLREQLRRVDEACAAKQAELNLLRETQRELRTALRAVDPSFREETKAAKRAPTNGGGRKHVAPETLNEILEWMGRHASRFPDGFCASPLARERDFPWSQATASAALITLHDSGTIRLDHRGTGGAKYYKVN